MVYVDRGGGAYEQRAVRLGRAGDEFWEVLDGVASGERVVTTASMLVDAQAQLNAVVAGTEAGSATAVAPAPPGGTNAPGGSNAAAPALTEPLPALTEAQRKAAMEFIAQTARLSEALAADSVANFNTEAARVHALLPDLVRAFDSAGPWRRWLQEIEAAGHLMEAAEIKEARKMFHPLSEAVSGWAAVLRRQQAGFGAWKIYRCPMTKDSFPGAPRTGNWIQAGASIRNPYFGAEMLDCGSEVK